MTGRNTLDFKLVSEFSPAGDQPQAIEQLVRGLEAKYRHQSLLGVTGSGKTFTIANVIAQVQRPSHSWGSSHRRAWTHPKVPIDRGRTGAGHPGAGQNPKGAGRTQWYWRLACHRVMAQEYQARHEDEAR